MMEEKKRLEWGETPWDNLSKEELVREVARMYTAVQSSHSVLSTIAHFQSHDPYWSNRGVGGAAVEMGRQITEQIENEWNGEDLYRAYFRYARDLMFDTSKHEMLGSNWSVCPICGVMLGSASHHGQPCSKPFGKPGCTGIMRPLEWDDLKPCRWDNVEV